MLTITMGLGILVSVILHAFTGLSAGGFVSSGYVALVLDQPVTLMTVTAISVLIWLLVLGLSRWLFLYGPRRFALCILLSLVLSTGLELFRPLLLPMGLEWRSIGYIVPGLIANQIDRQGLWQTAVMLAIAAPLVRILVMVFLRW